MDRKFYQEKIEGQLKALLGELERLRAEAKEGNLDFKTAYKEKIQDLEVKVSSLEGLSKFIDKAKIDNVEELLKGLKSENMEQTLKDLRDVGGETWSFLKEELEKKDLKEQLNNFLTQRKNS